MCGIFGIVTKDGRIPDGILENAARALAHRGPDDSGTVVLDPSPVGKRQVGLAHTRLSIIDLSPQGHQPMEDASTGNWIVFNGEIYNFRELRAELEAAGNRFQQPLRHGGDSGRVSRVGIGGIRSSARHVRSRALGRVAPNACFWRAIPWGSSRSISITPENIFSSRQRFAHCFRPG